MKATILGAIAGDVIGSFYEFCPVKTKDFKLFPDDSHFTDDTVMTVAVADWILTNDSLLGILQVMAIGILPSVLAECFMNG